MFCKTFKENVGKITEGVVVQMSPNGILLQLFGNARGFVPTSKISTVKIDHPEKLFFLGQALKCRVRIQMLASLLRILMIYF